METCCTEWNEYAEEGFLPMFEGSGWFVQAGLKVWGPHLHSGNCENYDGAPVN